jgi:hypothetical protein
MWTGAGTLCVSTIISFPSPTLKEFGREYSSTTATILRLSKPYFGTGRTIIGDSWFGSVTNAAVLYSHGLYSILMVKRSHAMFPKKRLRVQLDADQSP